MIGQWEYSKERLEVTFNEIIGSPGVKIVVKVANHSDGASSSRTNRVVVCAARTLNACKLDYRSTPPR